MSAIEINRTIFTKTLNRLRGRLFGEESLKLYGITPETGETEFAELVVDWSARRVSAITDGVETSAGAWKFQIVALDDWQTSQPDFLKAVALVVGTRRWKVRKVEKPIGNSKVWKIKAEIQ